MTAATRRPLAELAGLPEPLELPALEALALPAPEFQAEYRRATYALARQYRQAAPAAYTGQGRQRAAFYDSARPRFIVRYGQHVRLEGLAASVTARPAGSSRAARRQAAAAAARAAGDQAPALKATGPALPVRYRPARQAPERLQWATVTTHRKLGDLTPVPHASYDDAVAHAVQVASSGGRQRDARAVTVTCNGQASTRLAVDRRLIRRAAARRYAASGPGHYARVTRRLAAASVTALAYQGSRPAPELPVMPGASSLHLRLTWLIDQADKAARKAAADARRKAAAAAAAERSVNRA